jgi:hypothetical protein
VLEAHNPAPTLSAVAILTASKHLVAVRTTQRDQARAGYEVRCQFPHGRKSLGGASLLGRQLWQDERLPPLLLRAAHLDARSVAPDHRPGNRQRRLASIVCTPGSADGFVSRDPAASPHMHRTGGRSRVPDSSIHPCGSLLSFILCQNMKISKCAGS